MIAHPSFTVRHLVGALLLVVCASAAGAVEFEESPLAIEGANGRFEFQVELALSAEQRQQGLMFRESLDDDRGMLFDFGRPRPITMWMRNTYVSLDMLFLEPDGRIAQIVANTEPLSDATIASRQPARAVLELRGGISAELGIEPGDRVIHPLFEAP